MSKKEIIYTCVTDGYDAVSNHSHMSDDFDYVCFTDKVPENPEAYAWEFRPLMYSELDPIRNNRWHKLHPHVLFPEYQTSLWVDGNVDILSEEFFDDLRRVVSRGDLISISKHPARECLYDEMEACIALGKDDTDVMRSQVDMIQKDGLPRNQGLFETNIMLRRHNDEKVKKIMEEWWWWVENHSRRDQLSLTYVLWKNNFHVEPLSDISLRNHPSVEVSYSDSHITKEELWKRCDNLREQMEALSASVISLRSALEDSEQENRMIKDSKFWKLRELYMKLKKK